MFCAVCYCLYTRSINIREVEIWYMNKAQFRPLLEWVIRQKIMYARGRSWLDFIGVALIAGVTANSGILTGVMLIPLWIILCVCIAMIEERLGTWDYELDYTTRLNPYFRDLQMRTRRVRSNANKS